MDAGVNGSSHKQDHIARKMEREDTIEYDSQQAPESCTWKNRNEPYSIARCGSAAQEKIAGFDIGRSGA